MNWIALASAAIVAGFALIAVLGGVPLVERAFRFIDKPTSDDGPKLIAAAKQLRGGAWIGALERLATYACLMSAFPAGIAMVLAMKGLARYPELKASSAGSAERFIIGTFISILWAAAIAGIAQWTIGGLR